MSAKHREDKPVHAAKLSDAANGSAATVLAVSGSDKTVGLDVQAAGTAPLAVVPASLLPITVGGKQYLLGYDPKSGNADVYAFTTATPFLQATGQKLSVGAGQDILNIFTLGELPYLVAYKAKSGVFDTFAVGADFALSKQPYKFYRNNEPALSQNFATVKFFTSQGQVVFLGYVFETGYVALYTASVTPTGLPGGGPPILMLPAWAHKWAQGWTRFAFFQFGGENFFLKTNTWKPNVNIDHVLDTLSNGTVEVGNALLKTLQSELADAQTLTTCEPFYMGAGEPHFATYLAGTGEVTLNRFHGDCLGWTTVASIKTVTGGKLVVPVQVSPSSVYLLVV